MKWTTEKELKMVLTILEASNVILDLAAVAKVMAANGETCTTRAVEDRFRKLKREKRENDAAEAAARILVAMSAADEVVDTDVDTDVNDEDDGAAGALKVKVAAKAHSPVKGKVARKAEDNDKYEPM